MFRERPILWLFVALVWALKWFFQEVLRKGQTHDSR